MPPQKRRKRGNGAGRKPEGKKDKNELKGVNECLRKKVKYERVNVESPTSILEPLSPTINEENHSPTQLTANQLRQLRKINRRRVISNAEVADHRHQLRHAKNIDLTNDQLVELLVP